MLNMKRMKTKGQAALEASFVVLFIIVAVAAILRDTAIYNSQANIMAEARAQAQGAALNLSMGGTDTYIIRVDPVFSEGSSSIIAVDLYYASEACLEGNVAVIQAFDDALTMEINYAGCANTYTDEKFSEAQ